MRRIAKDIVRATLLDNAAKIHHDDAVGEMAHHMEIVADEQDRQTETLAQIREQIDDLSLDRDVERCNRLVGDNEVRIGRQGTCDGDALALASREFVGQAVRLLWAKPNLIEKGCYPLRPLSLGDGIGDPICNLIPDAAAWVQASERILKDHLHAPAYGPQTASRKVCDILTVENDAALGRIEETQQETAERALAAARFTDDTDYFRSRNFQINATDGENGFPAPQDALTYRERARQPLCLDQRLH
jgi:hypothetical protein